LLQDKYNQKRKTRASYFSKVSGARNILNLVVGNDVKLTAVVTKLEGMTEVAAVIAIGEKPFHIF